MFDGLMILGLIGAAKQIFMEATEKKQPANSRIDWIKIDEDERAGISYDEHCKRMARGYYHTTEPLKLFDLMQYRQDVLDGATPDELESNRKAGKYGPEKPIGYGDHRSNYRLWHGYPANLVVDVERYEWQRRNYPEHFEKFGLLKGYEYTVIQPKNWIYYSSPCWYKDVD